MTKRRNIQLIIAKLSIVLGCKKNTKEFFINFLLLLKGFFLKNLPSYELYLYEDSFKDYSFKIKIKSLHSNFQIDCVIYYSPNKNKFSFIFTKKI